MKLILEYSCNYSIDKISIYFKDEDVIIHKVGIKYDKLFEEIKNLNKQEITDFFSYKHKEYCFIFYNAC